jgi:hypothetical protein
MFRPWRRACPGGWPVRNRPDSPAADAVELRIHGVSGTPPGELLDRPLVRQVAGNPTAGFYRPRLEVERTDDPPDGGRGAWLEGYSWGGLTSGAPSRALWLLLLPFVLVNVAPRFRPPSDRPAWAVRGLWATTRVLALSLTVGFVLAVAGVGTDLLGWQCGALPAGTCTGPPAGVMRWLTSMEPGPRLAVASVVPLVVLFVLALLSLRPSARYPEMLVGQGYDPDAPDPDLWHPALWHDRHPVRRLRHLHLQVGIATVVGTAVSAVPSPGAAAVLVGVVTVVALAAVLACSAAVAGRRANVGPMHRAPAALWGPTLVVAAGGWAVLLTADRVTAGAGLPGYSGITTVFFAAQTAAVLVIGLCVGALRRTGHARAPLAGFAAMVVAAVALLVAGAFSAGTYVLAAAWLRTGTFGPAYTAVREALEVFEVPRPMLIGAVSFAVISVWAAVVVLGATGVVVYRLLTVRRWRAGVALLRVEYPDVPRDPARDAQILRIWWLARLVDHVGALLGVFLAPVIAFAVTVAVVVAVQGRSGWAAQLLTDATQAADLVAAGAYLVVGFLGLFILLGAVAFRVPATRRILGIVWDLASFWPRVAHPFAAPCYSERTLADLATRVRWYVGGEHGAEVLSGHSQGSVIGAALVAQLATADSLRGEQPPVLPHVAFLTHGSVLRRLYARYFPAYFGVACLQRLATDLTSTDPAAGSPGCRWRNLWRRSDHVGGPVDTDPWDAMDPDLPRRGPTDIRLTDPQYRAPGDLTPPAARRHSEYPADPEFQHAVGELAAMLPPGQGPTERQGRARSSAT